MYHGVTHPEMAGGESSDFHFVRFDVLFSSIYFPELPFPRSSAYLLIVACSVNSRSGTA